MATIYDQPTRTAEEVAALSTAFVLLWDQAAASRKTYKITAAEFAELMAAGGTSIADGSVTTAKLAASAVTYAKMQNVSATDRLLGRSTAGAGVVEEITCTSFARQILDDVDATAVKNTIGAADFTSTVNSLASLSSQILNLQPLDSDLTAIAALTTTSYGRSFLDRADATAARTHLGLGTLATLSAVGTAQITDANVTLAKLANSGAASVLLGRGAGSGAGVYQELTLGSGLSLSGTVLSASGGGGGTPGGSSTQVQFNNSGAFGGSADLTWSAGAFRVNGFIHAGASGSALRLSSAGDGVGVLTNDAGNDLSRVCFGGTTSSFPALKRSGTAMHLRLADDSAFANLQAAVITAGVNFTHTNFSTDANGKIFVGNIGELNLNGAFLIRDGNDVLAQRNGFVAQEFCVYNTFTSSNNFERGVLDWKAPGSPNVFRIGTEKGSGGGTARAVSIITDGVERIHITAGGSATLTTSSSVFTAPYIVGSLRTFSRNDGASNGYYLGTADDVGLTRVAANILGITNGSTGGGAIEFTEMTAPATPAANQARVFARDNGSGKTQVCIILPDGVVTVLATQT